MFYCKIKSCEHFKGSRVHMFRSVVTKKNTDAYKRIFLRRFEQY